MYLSTTAQNNTATLIAKWVRKNTIGYGAVATKVGQAGYPDAAIVAITAYGNTICTAKVAVYPDRIAYASKLAAHVVYPDTVKDVGPTIGGFLLPEGA